MNGPQRDKEILLPKTEILLEFTNPRDFLESFFRGSHLFLLHGLTEMDYFTKILFPFFSTEESHIHLGWHWSE